MAVGVALGGYCCKAARGDCDSGVEMDSFTRTGGFIGGPLWAWAWA